MMGPCFQKSEWLEVFIVAMNVFQAIALALVAQRSIRKNREERHSNGSESH